MKSQADPKTVFVAFAHEDIFFAKRLISALGEALPVKFEILPSDVIDEPSAAFDAVAPVISRCELMIYIASEEASESLPVQAALAWSLAMTQNSGDFRIIPLLRGAPQSVPHLLRNFRFIDF
ncbi:MAG: hypothetical protein CMP81_09705, partial [Fulvimarina sp.]|nr:hypothetical protein [Fulvimarina sp.]